MVFKFWKIYLNVFYYNFQINNHDNLYYILQFNQYIHLIFITVK